VSDILSSISVKNKISKMEIPNKEIKSKDKPYVKALLLSVVPFENSCFAIEIK